MDIIPIAGMIFVLILSGMVGGFVLLLPLTRRLGAVLEQRLQAGATLDSSRADLRRLESAVQTLQREVELISERQAFTESLLSTRPPALIPEVADGEPMAPRR